MSARSRKRDRAAVPSVEPPFGEDGLLPPGVAVPAVRRFERQTVIAFAAASVPAAMGGILLAANLEYARHPVLPPLYAFAAPFTVQMMQEHRAGIARWKDELRDFQRSHPAVRRMPDWEPTRRELAVRTLLLVSLGGWMVLGTLVLGGTIMDYHSGLGLLVTAGVAVLAVVLPLGLTLTVRRRYDRRWSRRNSHRWMRRKAERDLARGEAMARWSWYSAPLVTDKRRPTPALIAMATAYAALAAATFAAEEFSVDALALASRAGAVEVLFAAFMVGHGWSSGGGRPHALVGVVIAIAATPVLGVLSGLDLEASAATTAVSVTLVGASSLRGV